MDAPHPTTTTAGTATAGVRVAIDVGPLYGHRTGVGVATAGMFDALAARGDVALDPYLVSFRADPASGHRRLPLPGIVASHLWSRVHGPKVDRWARHDDLVHGTNYVVPPTSLPSVVSVYDCWFLRHPRRATPVVRRAGQRLRRAADHGAWIHASSDATAREVRGLLGTDRVVTVHLGPPPVLDPPSDADPAIVGRLGGSRFVLAIGTEEHRKDLARLVAAFDALGDGSTTLVLAGAPGDASADVDRAIAHLSTAAAVRVVRLGRVDDATKHWLLRHAAVLAYPSLDEGFGFPIVEAQLTGTPVVATAVGSIAEIGGQGVLLVEPGDTDGLAGALARALDDGGLRLALIEAGHRNVSRFSWSATADGLVALYRTAIGAGR
jgi:glycosyltransferase involved in cell wall biosynthesis